MRRPVLAPVVLSALLAFAAGVELSPLLNRPGEAHAQSSKSGTASAFTEINGKTIQGWVKEMDDPDPGVRERAVRTITLFDPDVASREAGPALIKLLSDTDAGVRTNTLIAMALIGVHDKDVKSAVAELVKRLDDPQGIVRFHAAVVIGTLDKDARPAIPALVNRSKDLASYEIRKAAVVALGRAGAADEKTPLDMRAADALIATFQGPYADKSAEVRMAAVKGLGAMGFPEKPADKQRILSALQYVIKNEREKAIVVWAHVGVMALDDVNDKDLDAICKQFKGKDFNVKMEALRALGALGPKAKSHASDVFDLLNEREPLLQAGAAWCLGEMGDAASKAVPTLNDMLKRKDTDERVKEAIKDALKKINGEAKK
jgi:HEAT repeat protein